MERLRSTKVVATIGPACDSVEAIQELIRAGMSVARLNFSHGNHESLRALGEQVRRAAAGIGANVALMADTRGPEIRTGPLRDGPIELVRGALFSLHPVPLHPVPLHPLPLQPADRPAGRLGDAEGVSVSYARLGRELEAGVSIFLDDGTIELCVESAEEDEIRCRVVRGGELGAHKGLSVPGVDLDLPLLGPADLDDLRFIAESDFDYVAASFVRGAEDIESIRRVLRGHGAEIPILAKIEHRRAVENLEALIDAADGTMVARGDLGVELPVERVPIVQKRIIRSTVQAGKPVITATQMLDSMVRNPRPTRAEASDVANAILDGTSAVMLSPARPRWPCPSTATSSEWSPGRSIGSRTRSRTPPRRSRVGRAPRPS
jgi:pyruvate kinase